MDEPRRCPERGCALRDGHDGPHTSLTPKTEAEVAHHGCHAKKRYTTETFANMVAASVFEKRGTPLRAYACMVCGGFHLTRAHAAAPDARVGWRPPEPSRRERAASERRLYRRGKRKDKSWR